MIKLNIQNREELLRRFEAWVEIPMLLLVLVMIATLIIPLVVHLPDETHLLLEYIDWMIWAIFALELGIRTYLAPKKLLYLRQNWIDVIVVMLPLLRIFRVFRAARLLRILRFVRVLVFFAKFTKEIKYVLSRHYFHYLSVILIGLIAIGAALIYYFDKGNNAPTGIKSIFDAFWLAVVIVVSGGYENIFPVTPEAKGINIVLILIGTVLVSYFTASLASYFSEKEQDVEQMRIEKKLDTLIEEVKKLKKSKEK